MPPTNRPAYRWFLAWFRAVRLWTGLTQAEFAKGLRRPQSFVSNCEAGEQRLDIVELVAIARLHDRRVDFVVDPRKGRG